MMYRPVLVTPPAMAPVSHADVRTALGISGTSEDDAELTRLIDVAVTHFDAWTGILGGRCLITQTWKQEFDCFAREMRLPMIPVSEITHVKYDDAENVERTVDAENYTLRTDECGSFVKFKSTYSFPSLYTEEPAVRITYAVGYANAAAVPEALRQAIILKVGLLRMEQKTNPLLRSESIDGLGSWSYRDENIATNAAVNNLIAPFVVTVV